MKITDQDLGKLVTLPIKLDWGPGIILKVGNGYAQIHFRDCPDQGLKKYGADENPLVPAAVQTDPKLNFQDLTEPAKKKKTRGGPRLPLDFNQAEEIFKARFPGGFADPAYLGDRKSGTRLSLAEASRDFGETLGENALGRMLAGWDLNVIAGKMDEFSTSLRLLSPELPGVYRELLKDPAQSFAYFDALYRVLQDPSVSFNSMSPYFDKIKACPVEGMGTWSAATALLFLAQPHRHLFTRPNMIKRFTEALGRRLRGTAAPSWEAYYDLTQAAGETLDKLKPLGAADMIDVYLFFRLSQQGAVEKTAV